MPTVHVIANESGNLFEVWLDTGEQECDGLCLSVATTEREALRVALDTLTRGTADVLELLHPRPRAPRKARRRAPR